MNVGDNPDVLEEVEALFKKLQHLPESVRQKALSCIQQKLPDAKPPKSTEAKQNETAPELRSRRVGSLRKVNVPHETVTVASEKGTIKRDSAKSPQKEVPQTEKSKSKKNFETTSSKNTVQHETEISEIDEEPTPTKEKKEFQASEDVVKGKVKLPYRLRVKKDLLGSGSDEGKDPVIDEETPVLIIEDVKTLHGRRTKRINAANLIRGIRKTKVIPSSPVKVSDVEVNVKNAVIVKQTRTISKKNVPVPSDVAESAEILASLSNEISQKDISHGTTTNINAEQTDYLKDKTNSQESEGTSSTCNVVSEGEAQVINVKLEVVPDSPQPEEGNDESAILDENEDTDQGKDELTCHFCEFKSTTKSALATHVRKHKENIPKAPFRCSECNKTFSQACGLQLHMKRHRGERDFACEHCPYRAFTKVDLTRHQTIHTGERSKICEYCGKAFAKDSTLRDHVKSIHERKVQHECEVCGFVTHRANNLRVHIRMRHHGEYNNHVCPVCGASVKQKNAFLEHMRSHTGERPYKCEECSAAFACLARLNVHRNAVHGERLFKCGDCDKTFQTKHHLLRHHAIHTKERPYACPFCSYACNTQGNIAKHVRSIHNCPDFSYRKYKNMQENGGQQREVDPEWVKKGEEVTKEYLNNLSQKLGRPVTLDELWEKEKEAQRRKEEQEKVRLALKEQKAARAEGSGANFMPKMRKRKSEEKRSPSKKGKVSVSEENQDNEDDPLAISEAEFDAKKSSDLPFYKLVTQNGNIQLCLETDEVQVYTGDATRELSLLQMKGDEDTSSSSEIQTIQGYMDENGQFVRLDEGMMVNEDSSTVVVIIDADMNEGLTPEVAEVMEITCEEQSKEGESIKRTIECDGKSDSKRKRSVLRIIKQES